MVVATKRKRTSTAARTGTTTRTALRYQISMQVGAAGRAQKIVFSASDEAADARNPRQVEEDPDVAQERRDG